MVGRKCLGRGLGCLGASVLWKLAINSGTISAILQVFGTLQIGHAPGLIPRLV